jgi:pimeloyl-ACP methyl ester carboxylesterase
MTPLSSTGRHDATCNRTAGNSANLRLVVVAAAVAVALTACSPAAVGHGHNPTTTASFVPPSTTPVTTSSLPTPQPIPGTTDGGSDAFLGAVDRVPVEPVPDGASTVTMPIPGTPAYLALGRIAYRSFGSGPALLLVMGEDGTMTWWEPTLLSSLAHHYRVVVFDLPGTGYSEPGPPGAPTIDSWADETAGLVESLGLLTPAVLGWGLGGDVALALAERHPGLAASLILADTSAGGPSATRPAAAVQRRLSSPWATAASLAADMFGPGGVAANATAKLGWLAAVTAAVPDDLTQSCVANETALADSVWLSSSLSAGAAGVNVPTLVVYGTADALYPPSGSSALVGMITGAQSLSIAGSGYAAMYEQPSVFITALEQFTG